MMDNELYEIARKKAFNKIRHQRDAHAPQDIEDDIDVQSPFKQELFVFRDRNAKAYSWVMQQAEQNSFEMFKEIVIQLLNKYEISHKIVNFDKQRVHPLPVIAFVTDKDKTLFIVESLSEGHVQDEVINATAMAYEAKKLRRIIMVYDYAYKFMFNHNNDENDPSRGTGLYSVRYLFETLFGTEEFEYFRSIEQVFSKEVQQYLGYKVVKTLTPNALYSFKKVVEHSLLTFPYRMHISELATTAIPDDQVDAFEEQFLKRKYYKALIGKCDYSQSFVTAEWLYDTMKEAGRIDYTAVAMGYFKAIEQLMFALVKRHIGEGRTLKKKGSRGYDPLTQANLDADNLDTTLGALIGFLKYYSNRDLFIPEIRNVDAACDGILEIIDLAKEDRNGYFHKDNIDDWSKIEDARVLSYLILALLLGAYEYSDQDRVALNIPEESEETEYDKICAYINYNSDKLFYISLDGSEIIPVYSAADDYVEVDEYGDPIFSGVYFRKISGIGAEKIELSIKDIMQKHMISTGETEKFQEETLPVRIYTGKTSATPNGVTSSGPLMLIYENGRYMLPEQVIQSDY